MKRLLIGLVGCGTIGSHLAKVLKGRFFQKARLVGVYDRHLPKALRIARLFKPALPVLPLKELIQRSDLVLEAASPQAVGELLPLVVSHRKSLFVMSTGGLLSHPKWLKKALDLKIPIHCPSGALAGIDGIKAGAIGGFKEIVLTTRKPPRAFQGSPEVARQNIRLSRIRSPRVLFQGPAEKAAKALPENINVAATLALAGIGPKRTQVKVVADPTIQRNIHEVRAVGDFGALTIRAENRPSQRNPKTSLLAVFSAEATLKEILCSMKVGT